MSDYTPNRTYTGEDYVAVPAVETITPATVSADNEVDTCDRCGHGYGNRINVGHFAEHGFDGLCTACLTELTTPATVAVVEYNAPWQDVPLYFTPDYWVDVELPVVRQHAAQYLFDSSATLRTEGDHRNGGFSVDHGGGEGVSYNWHTLTLSAEDAADTNIIGDTGVRGCSCGMADFGAPGHEGHTED